MNKALTCSLIFCSLILCTFVGIQWKREANLRADVTRLRVEDQVKANTLVALEGTIKSLQKEITRLDALKVELTSATATNQQEISQLRIELRKAMGESEKLTEQLASYKTALASASTNIQKQNKSIQKQNDTLKQLAEQRSAAIAKQNEVTEQYNLLMKRFDELQKLAAKTPNPGN